VTTQKPYSQIAYLFATQLINSRGGVSLADIAYVIDEAIAMAQQVQVSPKPTQAQCIRTIDSLIRPNATTSEDIEWNRALGAAIVAITKEM